MTCRIGILGTGFIARELAAMIRSRSDMKLAFIAGRSKVDGLEVRDLGNFGGADLVVEAAHPEVTHRYGTQILETADYMPLSATALVDDTLRTGLLASAERHEHRLLLPHGALPGLDALIEQRDNWRTVSITFRKPSSAIEGADISAGCEVVAEGDVRTFACRYPRNVNAMVVCALATVGLDTCRGAIIADPSLAALSMRVEATGADGATLCIERSQPGVGVSGTEMARSAMRSIERVASKAACEFV
jgi:aspartate dehydrogenase